jgi:enterochelin esterase-like enzyme
MIKGYTKDYQLYSPALQEEVSFFIHFPESFSSLYKYQLLIAQDGQDYFQLGRIGRITDELIQNKEITNTIVVGIPYQDIADRWSKYHPNGDKHQAYLRFLAHELVPFLDQNFPTYQMGLGRTLVGDSLAATVSLLAALEYPNTFGKVILQSPYVNETVIDRVKHFSQPTIIDIYHEVGTGETDVPTRNPNERNFLEWNRKLASAFGQKSVSYFYEEFEGDHTWTYWQPNLKKALTQILK